MGEDLGLLTRLGPKTPKPGIAVSRPLLLPLASLRLGGVMAVRTGGRRRLDGVALRRGGALVPLNTHRWRSKKNKNMFVSSYCDPVSVVCHFTSGRGDSFVRVSRSCRA